MSDEPQGEPKAGEKKGGFLSRVFGSGVEVRLEELTAELEATRSAATALEQELEGSRAAHERAVEALALVERRALETERRARKTEKGYERLGAEKLKLEAEAAAVLSERDALREQLDALQRRLDALEKSAQASREQLKAEQQKNGLLARRQLADAKERDELTAALAARDEVVAAAHAAREASACRGDELAAELAAARAELDTVREAQKQQSDAAKAAARATTRAAREATAKLEAKNAELATLEASRSEVEAHAARLEAEVANLRGELAEKARVAGDERKRRETLAQQEAAVKTLERRVAALGAERDEQARALAELQRLEGARAEELAGASALAALLGATTGLFLEDVFGGAASLAWRRWAATIERGPALRAAAKADLRSFLAAALKSLGASLEAEGDGYALQVASGGAGANDLERTARWLSAATAGILGVDGGRALVHGPPRRGADGALRVEIKPIS